MCPLVTWKWSLLSTRMYYEFWGLGHGWWPQQSKESQDKACWKEMCLGLPVETSQLSPFTRANTILIFFKAQRSQSQMMILMRSRHWLLSAAYRLAAAANSHPPPQAYWPASDPVLTLQSSKEMVLEESYMNESLRHQQLPGLRFRSEKNNFSFV